MLHPQRHQPDPFDRRHLPRDESRETVGFVAPAESGAGARAATASATALGIVYRKAPARFSPGPQRSRWLFGGQWGLRGTPQGYRSASGLVPDVNRAFATRQQAQAAAVGFAPIGRAETAP